MHYCQTGMITVSMLLWATAVDAVAATPQVVWSEEAESSTQPGGMRFGTAVVDDAEASGGQVVRKQSFQSSYHSCFAAGKFTRAKSAWLNYHWRVFKATAATGKLTIADWADADKPGGPVGQELAINFIELQPYTCEP